MSRALHKRIYLNPQANVYENDPFFSLYNLHAWKTDNPNASCLFFSSSLFWSHEIIRRPYDVRVYSVVYGESCRMEHANFHLFLLVFYIILTWCIHMTRYNFINMYNELYWNIFTWSHTHRERKPMKNDRGKEKTNDHEKNGEKTSFLIKNERTCSVHIIVVTVVRGECIEMKLTDIFHSISDFTIQFKEKRQHHSHSLHLTFCTLFSFSCHMKWNGIVSVLPIPSPSPVMRFECWVQSLLFCLISSRALLRLNAPCM